MSERTVVTKVIVSEEFVKEVTEKQVEAYLEKHLPIIWYKRKHIKIMTNKKSDEWIRRNIDNHPYVKKHGLAFPDSDAANSPMNYTREIVEFLDKFGLLKKGG